jgi:hypothetical protein
MSLLSTTSISRLIRHLQYSINAPDNASRYPSTTSLYKLVRYVRTRWRRSLQVSSLSLNLVGSPSSQPLLISGFSLLRISFSLTTFSPSGKVRTPLCGRERLGQRQMLTTFGFTLEPGSFSSFKSSMLSLLSTRERRR